jgi:hypothetical protein
MIEIEMFVGRGMMRRERQQVAAFAVIVVVQIGAVVVDCGCGGSSYDGRVALLPVVIGILRKHDDSYCMHRSKRVTAHCLGWVD